MDEHTFPDDEFDQDQPEPFDADDAVDGASGQPPTRSVRAGGSTPQRLAHDVPNDGREAPAHAVPLFSLDEIERYAAIYKTRIRDRDQRTMIADIIEHFRCAGVHRSLPPMRTDWRQQIAALERQFPNFADYFDFVRTAHALAEKEQTTVYLDPVLLYGAPGIGKTLVATQVAELLGTGCRTIHLESAQENSEIAGSSQFWANSQPGILFDTLVFSEHAGPMFVLDELDKTSASHFDPLAPLYGLLNRDTARTFRDLAHPWVTIDASHVMWVATANDPGRVPAPLLDRMTIFEVEAPTPEQSMSITVRIWQRLCDDLPRATEGIELTDGAVHAARLLSPRSIRRALRQGLGRALYHQRSRITAADISIAAEPVQPRRCGFV